MSDISFDVCLTCNAVQVSSAQEVAELKAEVEQLRQKTQYWPTNAERDAVIRHQKEEIERLRAAYDSWVTAYNTKEHDNERLREWNREIALNAREFVAENQRLRAALKPFVCDCEGEAICIGECMHRNARAALDGQPAPGKEEA